MNKVKGRVDVRPLGGMHDVVFMIFQVSEIASEWQYEARAEFEHWTSEDLDLCAAWRRTALDKVLVLKM